MNKKTCGIVCSGVYRQKERDSAKPCKVCGAAFQRQLDENISSYRRRVTCSKRCRYTRMAQTRTAHTPERTSPYPAEWNHKLRDVIRARDNHLCQLCGSPRGKRELSVHHIDYQKRNLDPSNLITLCVTCHTKTNHDRSYWEALLTTYMAQREDIRQLA